ncbi:MAG TPA: hypothetical protein VF193_13890 [Steroidobacter sp.]
MKWAIVFFGALSLAFWLLQRLDGNPFLTFLMRIPPTGPARVALWLLQAVATAVLLWWIWARSGADFSLRIAPAFTHDASKQRRYTPRQIRLAITALGGRLAARLPFEEPYWSGKHPAVHGKGKYPFPFHPLELGEAALAELFGFQLEGMIDSNLLEPETIPLARYLRSR